MTGSIVQIYSIPNLSEMLQEGLLMFQRRGGGKGGLQPLSRVKINYLSEPRKTIHAYPFFISNVKVNCFKSVVAIILGKNNKFSTFTKENYKGGVVLAPLV